MSKDEKRLNINGLLPGEKYAIQVRAVDGGDNSQWSQKYHIETIDDTAGGTRTPAPPALTEWKVDASGQYIAIWNNIKLNTDGSPMVVSLYELGLTAGGAEVVVPHYGQTAEVQSRSFNFGHLRAMFGGQIPTTISARLRVVNSAGTISEWSEPLEASLPVPNPPKNVTAQPVVDGIKLKWEQADDPIHLFGYRVYLSMTDPDFIPDTLQKSNMVYQGGATEFAYTSLSYDFDHHFKVVAYSEPGLESTFVVPTPSPTRPISPYGPDDKPPLVPVMNEPTMDRSVVTAPKANVSWEINETAEDNQDISGFVVRWRITGDTGWRNSYFEKTARSGVIDLPRPFSNYEFQVGAYDFVANYSNFSETVVLTGAATPPSAVTGVSGVPRWDGIRIVWDASNESVKYGGNYQVQIKAGSAPNTDTPIDYTTANTFIDVTGLTSLTEYFYRVRAVDSANQIGPWSTVVSSTLPAFPAAAATDGVAPSTAPQNPKATGGLNYVNVSWERVTNADAVFYEVYMDDGANVAITENNFVGESSGTSLMVTAKANGDPLLQETAYYFKVRAVDADGPGPESAEVSATLTQVLSTDLGINMAGENLYFNSSFDTDSDGNGVADYWRVYNNSPQTEPHTATLVAGRDNFGKAQRIAWTGVNSSTKGVYSYDATVLRPNTEYMLSFYARSNGGSGFRLGFNNAPTSLTWIENPTPHATNWQRYIVRFTTGSPVDPANAFISIENHNVNGGWVEIDDAQIEAGNTASAYKSGTVSIAKLASGRMSTAEMIIDTNGIVKSSDYNPSTKVGWAIHNGGIDVFRGQVSAESLVANSSIVSNMYINSVLEISSGGTGGKNPGYMKSSNYRAAGTNGASDPGAGFRLDSAGFDFRSGTVAVGTLAAGTITSPDIRIGAGGKITVDANGSIQSNNYSYNSSTNTGTGFKISNLGIEMWDTNSKINVNALESSTLTTTTITLGSGGVIQNANWAAGTGARWKIDDTGLQIVNGSITGSSITTDQIKSLTSQNVDGVNRYRFSINAEGYAEFVGARVYGNMLVGSSASNVIQSGNYNAQNQGWQIRGDGLATFMQVQTWNLMVYAGATVGGSADHHLKSANFTYGSAGWLIRGDGYAEFNGGSFRVGGSGGSLIWILDGGGSQGQIRFYLPGTVPGDGNGFNYIRARDWHCFEIRGAHGGAIEMYSGAAWDGHSLVRLIQDMHVTQTAWIDNTLYLGGGLQVTGGISVNSGGVTMAYLGGAGRRYVHVGNGGVLDRGEAASSSIRYKENVEDLTYTKEQILSLRPVHYALREEFKIESDADRYAGFIAEEAAEAGLDDFVIYENGEVESFDYAHFTAAQHSVLREHDAEIEALKAEVAELKALLRSALDK